MRKQDLIGTTMALSLAVFMSAVATGCGSKAESTNSQPTTEAVETMSTIEQEETASSEYEVTILAVPYSVSISQDTILMDRPDTAVKVADLVKDSVITVTGDVTFGGEKQDYYYAQVDTETGVLEGYVDGKYIDFNSKVEDSMMGYSEVEGGDGEETTEIIETEEVALEETTSEATSEVNTVSAEPYTMYTNTACNVRLEARKDSELLMTLAKNTEVSVYGEENGWSKIDAGGIFAYIKSSLLSSTKTEDKTTQSTTSKTEGASTNGGTSEPAQSQPQSTEPAQPAQPSEPAQSQPDTTAQAETPSQPQQSQSSLPAHTPVQNADGTISLNLPEDGYTAILTPNGKGWYTDQFGRAFDAQGNLLDQNGQPVKHVDANDIPTADIYDGKPGELLDKYGF